MHERDVALLVGFHLKPPLGLALNPEGLLASVDVGKLGMHQLPIP